MHDGSREGTRTLNGEEVPVFNELAILQPSHFGTYVVKIDGVGETEANAFECALSPLPLQ